MLRAKLTLIYTATVIMAGTFLIGLAGIFHCVDLTPEQVTAALIGPILGVIVAVFQGKHIFEDSESIFQLNRTLCDQEIEFKKQSANREDQWKESHLALQKKYEARIADLEAEVARWKQVTYAKQNRPKTISVRSVSPIVGGNETTEK